MNNMITWFELPVTDMDRAKKFYGDLMAVPMIGEQMTTPAGDTYDMAIFAADDGCVTGMLICGKDYAPGMQGAVVYLNGGSDLDGRLAQALSSGGKLLQPKTPVDGGSKGYFCQFMDTEGNRVGLYSAPQ